MTTSSTRAGLRRATDAAWDQIRRGTFLGADPVDTVVYLAVNAVADQMAAAHQRFLDVGLAELATLCAYEPGVVRVACVRLDGRGLLARTGDERWTLGPGHPRGYYAEEARQA